MFTNKKVAENKICVFYKNEFTGAYKGYTVLVAEIKKSGEMNYVVVENFQVIYASQQIEAVYCWIDMKKLAE